MSIDQVFVDKLPLRLGRRIGRGGEGDVFEVAGDSGSAIKLYTIANPSLREHKVAAMVANGLATKSSLTSFPNALARDRNGKFLGFRMRLVRDHKPLHELYAPGPRKQYFPQADYRFLVRAAANIARAVAEVHQSGCVIGDINHSGALISAKATASLIDADSFQFALGTHIYKCEVGVPEYTPPELQGKSLSSVVRTKNHDCFGLAVVMFQLLFMGRHPFMGTVRRGNLPALHEAIRDYRFVYAEGRNVGMDQPPGTPALSDFPDSVGKHFEAAFGKTSQDSRPSALMWANTLDGLEQTLVPCTANRLHHYPRESDECPWCFMEKQLGSVLFVPFMPGARIVDGVDPGSAVFDLEALWRQISRVRVPPRSEILPKSNANTVPVGLSLSERLPTGHSALRVAAGVGAVALLLFVPKAWLISLGLGAFSLFAGRVGASRPDTLRAQLKQYDSRWFSEVLSWQKRVGVEDLLALSQKLRAARDEYLSLENSKRREISEYQGKRRENQLHTFLENFLIRNARIKGIGPAKQAALASYGVDSAADISSGKVLTIPGIGPALAQDLVRWRAGCEARFVFSAAPNQTDAYELSQISARYVGRAADLRRLLSAGPMNLGALSQRVQRATETPDQAVEQLAVERANLRQKLSDLGITLPPQTFEWPTVSVSQFGSTSTILPPRQQANPQTSPLPRSAWPSATTPRTNQRSAAAGMPKCPRCSSNMVRRTARRGRNAGGSFWGCSRFPTCRGARNI